MSDKKTCSCKSTKGVRSSSSVACCSGEKKCICGCCPPTVSLAIRYKIDKIMLENEDLRGLIRHCDIHANYAFCGYKQMTTEQKALWRKINEWDDEMHEIALRTS